jgi:hypothetical protein
MPAASRLYIEHRVTRQTTGVTRPAMTLIAMMGALLVGPGCGAGRSDAPPPPTISGPMTEQATVRMPEIATDPGFPERRSGLLPGTPAFPVYPGATLVGSAARNRADEPSRGYRIVWTTKDPASAVIAWYQKALAESGWSFTPPSDGVTVEQTARIAKDDLEGDLNAEESAGKTTIEVVLGPRRAVPPLPEAAPPRLDLLQAPGTSFTFGVAGDFTLKENFEATVAKVKEIKPDLLLALGDLSYKAGGESAWCGHWAQAPAFKNLLLVAGNHDTGESLGGNIRKYIEHCATPALGIQGTYGRQYYFDFPTATPLARFIMVSPGIGGDTGGLNTNYKEGSPGYEFTAKAIDQARAAGIKWIFVGMHKNYISTMDKTNEISTDTKRTFMTMLLNKRVDIVFQGHEHGYERTKQLATDRTACPILPTGTFSPGCVVDSDDALVKGAGTVIHVIGTGGKDMRGLEERAERKYFVERFAHSGREAFGLGHFTVTSTKLTFAFVRSAGAMFSDAFTID